MTSSAGEVEHTTAAAVEEKAKLQKHFGRFDMFFFLVCTLVGLDTIGTVASNGAQGFTWLIFLVPVFFIPYALLTSELGSTFTEEGGPYIWTKLALGRFIGGVNALIYWIANPIWLGGTLCITAVATFNAFFFNLGGGGQVRLRAALHLDLGVGRHPLLRGRQVAADGRSMGPDARARLLQLHRRHLRDQARSSTASAPAASSPPTPSSSRSCPCSSSTTSASSCRTPRATR